MGYFREALLGMFFIFFIIFVFSVTSVVLGAIKPDIIDVALANPFTAPLVSQFLFLWNKTPLVLIFGAFVAILVAAFYAESQQRKVM